MKEREEENNDKKKLIENLQKRPAELWVEPLVTDMFLPLSRDESKGMTGVWKLVCSPTRRGKDNWIPATKMERRPPHLGMSYKMGLTPDVNQWKWNQWTSTLELQENTERKCKVYVLSFSSWHVVFLCPAKVVHSPFMLSFVLPATT